MKIIIFRSIEKVLTVFILTFLKVWGVATLSLGCLLCLLIFLLSFPILYFKDIKVLATQSAENILAAQQISSEYIEILSWEISLWFAKQYSPHELTECLLALQNKIDSIKIDLDNLDIPTVRDLENMSDFCIQRALIFSLKQYEIIFNDSIEKFARMVDRSPDEALMVLQKMKDSVNNSVH
jgi:hypothetical protein